MALITGIIGAASRPEVEDRPEVEEISPAVEFVALPPIEPLEAAEPAKPEPSISERSYTLVGRAMRIVMKTFSPSVWQSILRKLAEQLPEIIELEAVQEIEWSNRSRHDQFVEDLSDQGFKDAGTYVVESMNTKVHLMVNEAYDIRAVVYEHEDSGIVLDLVTLFGDGTGVTYVNRQDPGIEQSPLHPNVYLGNVPVFELLDYCLRERPKKARIPETTAAAPRLMELEYAFGTRRMRGAPVNPVEVADAYLDAIEHAASPRVEKAEAATSKA